MTEVYIESGSKRVFACAYDWPGWCRAGKDEATALAALRSYAARFAPVAKRARIAFDVGSAGNVRVAERLKGSATTDFGAPGAVSKQDSKPLSVVEARRLAALVKAAWAALDAVIARAPAELRKGPRGGGRDRDQIAEHVLAAEAAYARQLGLRLKQPVKDDRLAIAEFRAAISDTLAQASRGVPPVEKRWPQRYAARRIAWHALDHAWEIEDRSESPSG
jgi:hypothetical protein